MVAAPLAKAAMRFCVIPAGFCVAANRYAKTRGPNIATDSPISEKAVGSMASAGSLLSPCSEKSAIRRKSDLAMISADALRC